MAFYHLILGRKKAGDLFSDFLLDEMCIRDRSMAVGGLDSLLAHLDAGFSETLLKQMCIRDSFQR